MGRFRKKDKAQPEIPTSALPDIIFILLFFFMVTTTMKENNAMVATDLPTANQLKKVPKEMQKITISIGSALDQGTYGTEPVIQIGSKIVRVDELGTVVSETLSKMKPTKRSTSNIVAYIKGDEGLKMGLVNDVTQKLRKLGVLNVDYSAIKGK
jgi:biopolymer transport protein ExbD